MTLRREEALGAISSGPRPLVVASDFDGTLSLIVEDPRRAEPVEGAAEALITLAGMGAHVAVVSGRPVAFLERALGRAVCEVVELFGRYGAEHAAPGSRRDPAVIDPLVRAALVRLADDAQSLSPLARVEDKGGSVALHWREHPELEAPLTNLARHAVEDAPIELRPGRMMVDVVARDAPTKGGAIAALVLDSASACFLGDDLGDLDAFLALDAFQRQGGNALRIAVHGAETPSELDEQADLVLAGPADAISFLTELARALS